MAFPTCSACKKNGKSGKVLKCLHTVCVGCLERFITLKNEVRCPDCAQLTPSPGAGRSQLLSLPDSICSPGNTGVPNQAGGERLTVQPTVLGFCDECAKEETAICRCSDCGLLLCRVHSQSHPLSRATVEHRVEAIDPPTADKLDSDGASRNQEILRCCLLHPSQKLQTFCKTCNELLCELCVSAGCGHDSTHSPITVKLAASTLRSRIEAKVGDSPGSAEAASEDIGSTSIVSQAIESVSGAIKDLHDQTEAVSDQVQKHFQDFRMRVDAREGEVLENLDRLRFAKLLPLEGQKQRLLDSQQVQRTASDLLVGCTDVCDFVRMASWLEEAVDKVNEEAGRDGKPCVAAKLVFAPGNESKLSAALAESVDILDAAIDESQSTVQCTSQVFVQHDLAIKVEAVNHAGRSMNQCDATMLSVHLEVVPPEGEAVECKLVTTEDGKPLVAKYRPAIAGKHHLIARCGSRQLNGSPADIMVIPRISFLPDKTSQRIQLSNDYLTATKGRIGHQAVCSANFPTQGRVDLRVRLDSGPKAWLGIFVCNRTDLPLGSYTSDSSTFGWHSQNYTGAQAHRGLKLGQPWMAGDVIHLVVDCDQHTLTGRHERTGETETLRDVCGDLYLYIAMQFTGTQVTIL